MLSSYEQKKVESFVIHPLFGAGCEDFFGLDDAFSVGVKNNLEAGFCLHGFTIYKIIGTDKSNFLAPNHFFFLVLEGSTAPSLSCQDCDDICER